MTFKFIAMTDDNQIVFTTNKIFLPDVLDEIKTFLQAAGYHIEGPLVVENIKVHTFPEDVF